MTLYRLLLRLLPATVREVHGEEMAAVFAQLLRERRARAGWRGAAQAAAAECAALVRFAWSARRGAAGAGRLDERLLAWPSSQERRSLMRGALLQDIRYAIRLLLRTPGVTAACVLTMALAIGANTAVFSLVHGVLLAPLPFPDEDRLVVLGHASRSGGPGLGTTTPGNYYDWQGGVTAFDSLAAFAYTRRVIARGDFAESVLGVLSVGSAFDVLQRSAAAGRALTAADDDPAAPAVVVLGEGFARRLFGTRTSVGESLLINGLPVTVVGEMGSDFAFPDFDAQYWVPARLDAAFRGNRDQYFLLGLGRMRAGVSAVQVQAQLDTVMDGIRRQHPQATEDAVAAVVPLRAFIIDDAGTRLWLLLGGVAVVLVVACANIANLLLARGASRRREMAVRHALGARGGRLVRQLLTESAVLAIVGGIAGLAIGALLLDALLAWLPLDLPRANGVSLDRTVLAVSLTASALCGLAFGLWPALRLSFDNVSEAVRQGGRDSARRDPVRAGLVVAQVALSLLLVAGAGLLARSFDNLSHVNPGFAADRLLTFTITLPGGTYRDAISRQGFFERAIARLERLPGVTAVGLSSTLPVAGRGTGAWFTIIDRPTPADRTPPSVPYRVVTPGYLETLGIPVLRGRTLSAGDGGDGPPAVVISEAVERRFWPGEGAIGKRIYLGAPDNRLFPEAEIVGIAGDVKQAGLDEMTSEAVYIPLRLSPRWTTTLSVAVRTLVEPATLGGSARAAIAELDPAVPVLNVQTMDEVVARSLAPARSSSYLLALFAVMALALAVVGVFGVVSYAVTVRRQELAIRLAVGAPARSVMLLVLGQGGRQVLLGIALGLVFCAALARYIESLLFGVRAADPWTLAAAALLLAAAASLAVYIPARRAMAVDPVSVLRMS